MGMFPKKNCTSSPYAAPNSNPNPEVFHIIKSQCVETTTGVALVVKVHYPDAKNFEGMKIMVYEGIYNVADLIRLTCNHLDPHFAEHGTAPIARFAPTDKGWRYAVSFAGSL